MTTPAKPEAPETEFLRPRAICRRFGVASRTLQKWISADVVKSHLVTSPGRSCSRMRLVDVASVREFITKGGKGEGR